MRDIPNESSKVKTGTSPAVRSHEALRFDLLGPEFIRRAALRKTVGAKKYGSVQWRQGLNDVDYMRDALNHLVGHLLNFLESGNEQDDNLGAMSWAIDALMECERLCPEVFRELYGTCQLFGEGAREEHLAEQARKVAVDQVAMEKVA